MNVMNIKDLLFQKFSCVLVFEHDVGNDTKFLVFSSKELPLLPVLTGFIRDYVVAGIGSYVLPLPLCTADKVIAHGICIRLTTYDYDYIVYVGDGSKLSNGLTSPTEMLIHATGFGVFKHIEEKHTLEDLFPCGVVYKSLSGISQSEYDTLKKDWNYVCNACADHEVCMRYKFTKPHDISGINGDSLPGYNNVVNYLREFMCLFK